MKCLLVYSLAIVVMIACCSCGSNHGSTAAAGGPSGGSGSPPPHDTISVFSGVIYHAAGGLAGEGPNSVELDNTTGTLTFSTTTFGTVTCPQAGGTVGPESDGYKYTVTFSQTTLTMTAQGSTSVAGWQLTLLQGPG